MSVYHEIRNTENTQRGYGITITWTKLDGKRKFSSFNFHDWDEAWREALDLARADGWYPPKWWEFWRWSDTRLSDLVKLSSEF